jgi:pectin methylesterase-like acyl-CoA thioesterase
MELKTRPGFTSARKPINTVLLFTVIGFVVVLAVSFVGAAIALGFRDQAVTLITVPDDYPTIQAAIDAASPGTVIQVRSGTYNENITLNKAVSLTAESFDQVNPANDTTIIDGSGGGAAILIPSGLTQMPTIRGFVIRNGSDGIQAFSEFIAEYNYFTSSNILTNYQLGSGGTNHFNVYFILVNYAIHV